MDGVWYNIDLTWDDPIYSLNGEIVQIRTYNYFLISDNKMYQNHVAENAKYICTKSYCDHEWEMRFEGNHMEHVCGKCELKNYVLEE